jgi:riboflavin transporter FmnP
MIIAMIMGLITGLVAAVIAEIPRLVRLHDERDVNYFIGVPMLAAIPNTPTETERRLAQRRSAVRAMTILIIGVAAVPLLAFILNASRLFHIIGYKH